MERCAWVPEADELYVAYHDEEWGVPEHDDRALFELLTLEGAQAGLSWATILRKREGYRTRVRRLRPGGGGALRRRRDVERLLARPGHRPQPAQGRVDDRERPARARGAGGARELRRPTSGGSSAASRSSAAGGRSPSCRRRRRVSKAMSKDLKRRGFRFVGPTVCYAFMQAAGLVNDHVVSCFRFRPAPS